MKKIVIMAVAAVAMSLGAAAADPIETPIGTVAVNEGGYLLNADGDAGNPDPADGFVSVSDSGQVCADDNGSAAESDSPTCS